MSLHYYLVCDECNVGIGLWRFSLGGSTFLGNSMEIANGEEFGKEYRSAFGEFVLEHHEHPMRLKNEWFGRREESVAKPYFLDISPIPEDT